ncbi:hypothetical protein B0H13DRAFT_2370540 [Mycena leptocephala]|nr:hypothetical protein B0H13DRAFT_2370540 [Mycena leptocephala]
MSKSIDAFIGWLYTSPDPKVLRRVRVRVLDFIAHKLDGLVLLHPILHGPPPTAPLPPPLSSTARATHRVTTAARLRTTRISPRSFTTSSRSPSPLVSPHPSKHPSKGQYHHAHLSYGDWPSTNSSSPSTTGRLPPACTRAPAELFLYTFYTELLEEPTLNPFKSSWLEALGDLVRYKMAFAAMANGATDPGTALALDTVAW